MSSPSNRREVLNGQSVHELTGDARNPHPPGPECYDRRRMKQFRPAKRPFAHFRTILLYLTSFIPRFWREFLAIALKTNNPCGAGWGSAVVVPMMLERSDCKSHGFNTLDGGPALTLWK